MPPYVIPFIIGLVAGMVGVGVPAFLFMRARERAFVKIIEAYERIVTGCDQRVADGEHRFIEAIDRFYASQNLAPGGVDMREEFEQRREKAQEREAERRTRPPGKIGQVDQAQERMARAVHSGKYRETR